MIIHIAYDSLNSQFQITIPDNIHEYSIHIEMVLDLPGIGYNHVIVKTEISSSEKLTVFRDPFLD